MLSALLVSSTERLLLLLGWERESVDSDAVYTKPKTQLAPPDAGYDQLKSQIRNLKIKKKDPEESTVQTSWERNAPTLRPMNIVAPARENHLQQSQAWTSASAFDAAPSGTV